jgi:predicted amidophosphoribosyltransferase
LPRRGRKCPACAEFVSKEAKVCKHCRTELVPDNPVVARPRLFETVPQMKLDQ